MNALRRRWRLDSSAWGLETQRAGLPELETAEFDPVSRFDALGKEHTFYFAVMMTTGLGIRATE